MIKIMLQNTLLEFDMHVFGQRYSITFCTHMLLNTKKNPFNSNINRKSNFIWNYKHLFI